MRPGQNGLPFLAGVPSALMGSTRHSFTQSMGTGRISATSCSTTLPEPSGTSFETVTSRSSVTTSP